MDRALGPELGARPNGLHQLAKQPLRFAFDRAHDSDELQDIEPTLTTLVFGDEGLWPAEALSDLSLGQLGSFSGLDQKLAQQAMLGTVDGFAHAARLEDDERRKLIPVSDYPK